MKRASVLLPALLAFIGVAAVGAQAELPDAPVVILANNNLYAWTPESEFPTMLTMNGYIEPPAVSPDATEIAYAAYAPITIDALMRTGGIGGGALPSDIWVMNPATRQTREIAVQPPDASFFVEGVPDKALMRSQPVWSPDALKLAWTEQTYPGMERSLMVYNFATGNARAIATDLPEQAGVPVPLDLIWGGPYIVLRSTTMDAELRFVETLLVYDDTGTLVSTIGIDPERVLGDYIWLEQDGQMLIGVRYADGWAAFDAETGAEAPLNGTPEMVAALAPDTSLSLAPTVDETGREIWQAYDAAGQPGNRFSSAPYYATERITLSPDGQAVAFSDYFPETRTYENTVRVVSGNAGANIPDVADDPLVRAVVWGPVAWRVRGPAAP